MFGTGLLKGLGVTLKHALDTFEDDRESVPDRYRGSLELGNNRRVIQQPIDQEGLLTIQYPEEKRLLPERFRYIPMLIWDSEKQEDRCTACGICAKVCPPQCIWIVRDSDENGKPMTRCSDFYIDAAVCMSCSFCVEFCPFDAIKMNHDYELAVYDRYPQLVYDMAELTVPLEYYAALWPTQYEEEQARRKEEEEQKRKQEEEKAAKAAARAAAKSAAAAEESAGAAPRRSAAELQALAKERAAQRQAQAADGGGSDDDAAAAKRARMEELKRRAQERARARKAESGE
ncbi:MAG: 4Fe-4S dicluster domain-containing protein [Caldilineaceae bacterium SB0675_bin_29]|uniref:4Fe-4S dicluster domain-containing protein n=1 Tax=Caldilineaceae bacterium SB0675_bin_29 TaxID=2605266 RepID=A0A6B1G2D7_9CHLR|nr:4Fe-4S dicluster domain-containing protein [Caldilineaceae bacterium SB0675_bin_29]